MDKDILIPLYIQKVMTFGVNLTVLWVLFHKNRLCVLVHMHLSHFTNR